MLSNRYNCEMQNANLKIYGRCAALTIEPQVNATRDLATIGIEAARKKPEGNTYDWGRKMAVQVTARELPTVQAVLMGYKNECEFRYHGLGRNKSYSIRSQQGGVLITLSAAKAGVISVPVEPADLFSLNALVVQRIQLNQPWLSTDSLLALVKRSYAERTISVSQNSEKTNEIAAVS